MKLFVSMIVFFVVLLPLPAVSKDGPVGDQRAVLVTGAMWPYASGEKSWDNPDDEGAMAAFMDAWMEKRALEAGALPQETTDPE